MDLAMMKVARTRALGGRFRLLRTLPRAQPVVLDMRDPVSDATYCFGYSRHAEHQKPGCHLPDGP